MLRPVTCTCSRLQYHAQIRQVLPHRQAHCLTRVHWQLRQVRLHQSTPPPLLACLELYSRPVHAAPQCQYMPTKRTHSNTTHAALTLRQACARSSPRVYVHPSRSLPGTWRRSGMDSGCTPEQSTCTHTPVSYLTSTSIAAACTYPSKSTNATWHRGHRSSSTSS